MVLTGIEVLRNDNFRQLRGKRVGLLTNTSAVDHNFSSTYTIMHASPDVNLTTLFSPEHGIAAAAPDATAVDSTIDPRTGLTIYSLYGQTYRPTAAMLADIDVLVCDIQDIGVRFYTYIWTISYILEACGEHGVEVMILDRPNPIGDQVDGPPLGPEMASFVGRFNIPIRHGMSVGELSQMINGEWNPTPADLTVIAGTGWRRTMLWDETGLPFVAPSPAIPHFETTLHYPGSCLIEGTALSEGRGTALPFEIIGAPYIDSEALSNELNALHFAGVRFRPHAFTPTSSKYINMMCFGVQAHITDRNQYSPIKTWLGVIRAIRLTYSEEFAWLYPDQEIYERGTVMHFDRLAGSPLIREQIDSGVPLEEITANWAELNDRFRGQRQPYLIYR